MKLSPVFRGAAVLLLLAALTACSGPQVLSTISPAPSTVDRATNLIYMPGERGKMDVYSPQNVSGAPMVVFFHGGRWSAGHKDDYAFVGEWLAKQGFVAVVPNYRLYPQVRFPAFLEDAARAVVAARELAPRYGANPQHLFLMGHSSGAHMAAMLSTDAGHMQSGGGSRDMISGFIGMAGPYDFLPLHASDLVDIFGTGERAKLSQPVNFVDGSMPPALLLHGENDTTVKIDNARSLARKMASVDAKAELIAYDSLGHARILAALSAPLRGLSDVDEQIEAFIRAQSGGNIAVGTAPIIPTQLQGPRS